jgi:DTW domain-containing protein YfiP
MDVHHNPVPPATSRCFDCFRPANLCFCDSIPSVDNRTDVLILQHRRERFHPFNTARIVRQGLRRCHLLADHNFALAEQFESATLSDKVGLLYPGDPARVLTDLLPAERPDQLIVIDGTWHHAKSLMRDIPRLRTLPQYRLAPTSPGRYRIRREPNEHALSTIEATVSALKSLEPETVGLDQLLQVFERMIDDQLGQSDNSSWRQNRRRRPGSTNVPKALSGDISNVVVAYGEQEPGKDSRFKNSDMRAPVFWVAERLGTGEAFQCAIQPKNGLNPEILNHMQLTHDDFRGAVSIDVFREQWKSYLRPSDQIAVYHPSTARVLHAIDAAFAPTLVLKSIKGGPNLRPGTLDDFLAYEGIQAHPRSDSRAGQRLANAIAYVRLLNSQSPSRVNG